MPNEVTPFLNLVKPEVKGPQTKDVWGYDYNANFDKLDAFLQDLVLAAGAAFPSNAVPLPNGVPAPGTSPAYSRADHIHRGDVLNIKDYGAGSGIASQDEAAFDLALATGRPIFVPDMQLFLSRKISVPQYTGNDTRFYAPRIFGMGRYGSIINAVHADACFEYAYDTDAIFFGGIQIRTTTAGGLRLLGGCGGFVVDDFFMSGCGLGQWGVDQPNSFIYPGVIRNSRFAHEGNDYQGGVLRSGSSSPGAGSIAWSLENNFITRQMKNGPIVQIQNCNNFSVKGGQYEGTSNSSTFQTFFVFNGFNSMVVLEGIWFEGLWDLILGGAGSVSSLKMRNCRCWQYETEGKPNAQILIAHEAQRNWELDGIEFNSGAGASSLPIIDAPYHNVDVKNFYNSSVTNDSLPNSAQLGRPVTQLWMVRDNAGVLGLAGVNPQPVVRQTPHLRRKLGNAGVAQLIAGNIYLFADVLGTDPAKVIPSVWWVYVTIFTEDGLTSTTGCFEVSYGPGYTNVVLMKAPTNRGDAPTGLDGTVTQLGVFTPYAAQRSNQNHWMTAHGELKNLL